MKIRVLQGFVYNLQDHEKDSIIEVDEKFGQYILNLSTNSQKAELVEEEKNEEIKDDLFDNSNTLVVDEKVTDKIENKESEVKSKIKTRKVK